MDPQQITSGGAAELLDTSAASPLTTNLLATRTPPQAPQRPELRSFLDVKGLRNAVYGRTLEAINSLEPQTDGRFTLRLRDARYIDPETVSGKRRKQALLRRETLARRIKGTWELEDAETGKKQAVEKVIARVPVISNLGTILHNGNDYVIRNQQRLRSGMYVRRQENGEIEAHANIAPGKGPTHHYTFDPDKGIFRIRMNQANIPLLPLLKLMGATDRQLSDAWGNEIYYNNASVKDTGAIKKIQERLLRGADATENDEGTVREKLLNAFANMEMEDEVNQRTLGKPHKGITLDTLMDTTKKLIKLSRGEVDPDSRDSLVNQSIYTPDDFFVERITKDHGKIRRDLFRKIVREQNLEKIPAGVLTEQLENAFLGSGLGQAMEEINTLEILDKLTSVTRMGEGSIGNVDSIPDEARNVQPSQYNYIDPIRTPECHSYDTEVMTIDGWKLWPDVTMDDRLACMVDGRLEFNHPIRLIAEDYTGRMYGFHGVTIDYLVTPNHRMYVTEYLDNSALFLTAEELYDHEKPVRFMRSGHLPWLGDIKEVKKPFAAGPNTDQAILDWATLFGSSVSLTCNDKRRFILRTRTASPNVDHEALVDALKGLGLEHQLVFKSVDDETWCSAVILKDRLLAGKLYQRAMPDDFVRGPLAVREAVVRGYLALRNLNYSYTREHRLAHIAFIIFTLGGNRYVDFNGGRYVEIGNNLTNMVTPSDRIDFGIIEVDNFHFYERKYTGKVYCAEVPGGLLYTRRNNSVGFWNGNSLRAGVDGFLALNARRGNDQKLYTQFKNLKTGEVEYKNPQEVENSVLAFPGVLKSKTNYVPAMKGGKIRYVPKSQVEYVPVNMEGTFSPIGNLVPFKSGTKPQRMAMASRMLTQALPLATPEAPFVQAGIPGEPGKSYEERYANYMGAVRAEQGGKVLKIADGTMTVRYDDGSTAEIDVVENTPFNRKTSLSQYPMVQPGDRFEPNQLLVKSNFTNDKGETALGLNARVAYWPYLGYNFEDAIVVSESFAKRATSEHVYQHDVDVDSKTKVGKNAYVSLFPRKFNNETLQKIDKNGVVQVGTEVNKGDPLILAATERDTPQNKIHKRKQAGFNDGAVLWEHDEPGIVTDVEWGKTGPTVIVKSKQQLKEADKLSGRYGDKGILAKILPDHLMPTGEDGKPFEVLLSPDSIPTRTNPSQMVEAFLGKIAEKTGKVYKVADFEDIEDLTEFAQEELRKHGLKDQDTLFWPERGKKVPNVYTGNRFLMKLMHTAEDKNTGRSSGAYTMDDAPAKGGSSSSKRVSLLDMNALLSHGAVANIRDSGIIRGQKNEDLWLQFMQGYNPTQVKVPKAYDKFVHQLQASGINVVPKGGQLQIMAVTDKDVDQWSGGRTITNGDTVDFVKGAKPVKGGLFDPQLTGSHGGNRWAKIALAEPMPNPVMEEPIRRLLNLTKNQYMEVISGDRELGKYGTGTIAIRDALADINVHKEIAAATQHMNHGSKVRRDEAVRKLKYLQGAEKTGLHPKDWVLNAAPVLPPVFRPVAMMGGTKVPLIADANFLYKDLITANSNYVAAKKELGSKHSGAERAALYNAFKAVTGLGDPVSTKSQEKKVSGILKTVFGASPKYGTVQRKLLSSTVDNVGRAVISPNPDLDMDHVGIPEDRAFDVYAKFVARRLRRRGMPLTAALQEIKDRTPRAKEALMEEMQQRPVYINRAPVLHRFGIMAFWPKLAKGNALQVSPLVVKGFNADFDGDTMQYHVPSTEEAIREAVERMMPSRNLISPKDFKKPVHTLGQQYLAGLYESTKQGKKSGRVHTFATVQDAVKAYEDGIIAIDDEVKILR